MKPIKVIELITSLDVGGAEKVVLDLSKYINSDKFEIIIVSMIKNNEAITTYGNTENKIYYLNFNNNPFRSLYIFYKLLKSIKPDIIHAHLFHPLLLSTLFSKFFNYKLIFTSHVTILPFFRSFFIKLTSKFRNTDILFNLKQHNKINCNNTLLIHNGVDVDIDIDNSFNVNGIFKFIFVGRISEQKDPLGLIRSFYIANIPNSILEIIGDGPLLNDAIKLVKDYNIENKVKFLGLRKDVRGLLKDANVFLLHSKYEGLPLAVLEAGAEGLPVLATDVGVLKVLLNNQKGYISNIYDFPKTMNHIYQNYKKSIEYGKNLKSYISTHYSTKLFITKHEELYYNIIKIKNN